MWVFREESLSYQWLLFCFLGADRVVHFHDLRHSAATIPLCMGVNVKVIQELLGHSDISVTLGVYGHLLPSMQQAVVETWDGVFGENGDKGPGQE